jgi:hypothetical protein
MGYFLAILGSIAGFAAVFATTAAFAPGGSDIQLILGGVYGVISAVFFTGAAIVFRMDDNHSKKDTPK